MSRIAAVLMVVAGWLVASPVASAHGGGASVLAKRASLTHGIAGDQRYVFTTEPGIGDSRPGGDVAGRARLAARSPSACRDEAAYDSIVFGESPTPIEILRGLRCSGFGMRISSTPRSKLAVTASASTPSGSVSEREKEPNARSTRW